MDTVTVSTAVVAAALLEGIKFLVRYFKQDPAYDFPVKFYVLMLPILSFACAPLLAFLGFSGYTFPMDWASWGLELGRVVLTSLLAVATYQLTFKPFKDYRKSLRG